jgi:addiction module HigA family antidote
MSEVFHPAKLIKEQYLEPNKIGSNEFSRKLKLSKTQISLFLNEKANISPNMAIRLTYVLGKDNEYWLSLQNKYDLAVAKQDLNFDKLNLEKLVA